MVELLEIPQAQNVVVTDDALTVDLSDGRTISVPLAWYPRLLHSTPKERNNWRFIGGNDGIHWPDIDEDISIKNIILGKPSGESKKSFQRWLEERKKSDRT
ncbi:MULTISPECIES: DUF2442 domain-containing protein [unclassified Microcoleus]|uniref:DUF2442 domain-containing protein n=1 Tax=unclassified Microcoleus TaxID=2642155 RepID=UPI002FD1B857